MTGKKKATGVREIAAASTATLRGPIPTWQECWEFGGAAVNETKKFRSRFAAALFYQDACSKDSSLSDALAELPDLSDEEPAAE